MLHASVDENAGRRNAWSQQFHPESLARAEALQDFLLSPDGVDLTLAFQSLTAPAVRRQFLDLIRACAAMPAGLSTGVDAGDSCGPANAA